MKINRVILTFICFILFFSIFILSKDGKKQLPEEVIYRTEYEHNYFVIKDQIRKNYSISGSHIKIIQKERKDSISFVLFSFMDEEHQYIGQLSYIDDDPDNNKIPSENVHTLKIHSLKDKKTPFKMMTSMIKVDQKDYCFYYGWINDANVKKIEFDFIDKSIDVHPNGQRFFYLLRNKNMKMNKTTALDSNSLVIQEYSY
ncbi:MAG TPA: hypothetical protein VLM88_02220 [Proteiniclasticum sp.]|nr:hypothetical protein [Proteiniclasticum sp.]